MQKLRSLMQIVFIKLSESLVKPQLKCEHSEDFNASVKCEWVLVDMFVDVECLNDFKWLKLLWSTKSEVCHALLMRLSGRVISCMSSTCDFPVFTSRSLGVVSLTNLFVSAAAVWLNGAWRGAQQPSTTTQHLPPGDHPDLHLLILRLYNLSPSTYYYVHVPCSVYFMTKSEISYAHNTYSTVIVL